MVTMEQKNEGDLCVEEKNIWMRLKHENTFLVYWDIL